MPKYLVLWKANPAAWPTDPKQALAVLEGAIGGGDQLLSSGGVKELGMFTAENGFATFDVPSKDAVLGMVQPFFPYYIQEIREVVPWEDGKRALLESARRAASR